MLYSVLTSIKSIKTMASIYNISQELNNILETIEFNDGELTPELEEALVIKQEELKDKIKSYTEVITMIKGELQLIKEEKERLDNLKQSKEKTIERLKKVIIEAVENFGNVTKSGSKYIDYGLGKVSIRNSEVLEVDKDITDRFANRWLTALSWFNYQGVLDMSITDTQDILEYCNEKTPSEEADGENIYPLTLEDLDSISADINLNITLKDLITTEKGFAVAKALINYNNFQVQAKVNKTDIKREIKQTGEIPNFANLTISKSLIIK